MKKDKRWLVCEKCYNEQIFDFDQLKGLDASMSSSRKNEAKIRRAVVRENYDHGKEWGNCYQDICHCLKDGKCNYPLETTVLKKEDEND